MTDLKKGDRIRLRGITFTVREIREDRQGYERYLLSTVMYGAEIKGRRLFTADELQEAEVMQG